MNSKTLSLVFGVSAAMFSCVQTQTSKFPKIKNYPQSRTVAESDTYHGIEVKDPYRWLENMETDEVKSWIANQDSFTSSFIDTLSVRSTVEERYNKIRDLKPGYISGVPRKAGDKYFFSSRKMEPSGLYVSTTQDKGNEELLISHEDVKKLGGLEQDMRIIEFQPSRDGKYLAIGVADGGAQWNTWYLLDVATKELLNDKIQGMYLFYSKVSWDVKSNGFYYNGFKAPEGSGMQTPTDHEIRYHQIGTDQSADIVIYKDEENPGWIFSGDVTEDGNYFVFTSLGREVNNVYYKDLKSDGPVVQMIGGREHRYMFIGAIGDDLYFAISKDSPNLRVVKININNPEYANWEELIAERDYPINSASLLGNKIIVEYLKDVSPLVKIFSLSGALENDVELPYIGGWLVSRRSTGFMNAFIGTQNDPEVFFGMNGQTDPGSIFKLDIQSGNITVHSRPELTFDPDDFITEQVFYNSKDGTKVPMFLIYKKGLKRDGANPTWLYAYGFNFPSTLYYVSSVMAWMDMGGVYAYPGIRGGSDYGQKWIEAGAGRNKQNAIDDYIYAGKYLIEAGYTSSDRLIANGGSASGPLPAAAIIQEPSLFGLAYIDIPLLDMIRMYDYISQIITTGWGSRENKEDFLALYDWSPYHNLKPANYPPTIITPGEKDQIAFPLHAYKFTAALQNAQQNKNNPIFLQIAWGAGHYSTRRTEVNQLAFAAYLFDMNIDSKN